MVSVLSSFVEELSLKPVTNWVIADLASKEGRVLVRAALQQVVGHYFSDCYHRNLSKKDRSVFFSVFSRVTLVNMMELLRLRDNNSQAAFSKKILFEIRKS